MIKISDELLSEVMQLGILEVGEVDDCYLSFNYYILDDDNIKACINIYELAHKCKEWAMQKGYILQSWYHNCICINFTDNLSKNKFSAHTEIEAIIKACEWVLGEIKK